MFFFFHSKKSPGREDYSKTSSVSVNEKPFPDRSLMSAEGTLSCITLISIGALVLINMSLKFFKLPVLDTFIIGIRHMNGII